MPIIITKPGQRAIKVDKTSFVAEENLQRYIFENPESLPLYEIEEDIKLLILAREFDTESGPIDAFGVDRNGNAYIIETKLYRNTDKRHVVAQVLDYGAALWRNATSQGIMAALGENCRRVFGSDLRVKLQDYFGLAEEDAESLESRLSTNLGSGTFRFVVLMDQLHDRLKDLILFLNANSRFTVFAVEMEYYKYESYEIVIPKLFGSEVKKEVSIGSGGARMKWDEESFFADASKKLPVEDVMAIKQLFEFVKQHADRVSWGTGSLRGSFNPKFDHISIRSILTVYSSGEITFNLEWLNDSEEATRFRERWRDILNKRLGLGIGLETKYRTLKPEEWVSRGHEVLAVVGEATKEKTPRHTS